MGAIDIGSAATDRASTAALSFSMLLDTTNPADGTGSLSTFGVWLYSIIVGDAKIGTFSGSGTDYTSRDFASVGTITAGSKQTFTFLDCDVSTNDVIGIYLGGYASIEASESGGSGLYSLAGDQFGTGIQTYSLNGSYPISLYGTGISTAVSTHPLLLCGVGD
jgi:hypothetical protein